MEKFTYNLLAWTEKKLTLKKAKKEYQKRHKTVLSEVLEWVDAILFAVIVVFFINQWLFQLFVIPSPSMEKTLLTGDRVLVSKLTYGVEVYPEGPKILDSSTPERDDIITFYNPESESKGTLFNILSQMIFRATFTLVNIDKNEDGSMREALLVKRAAGMSGDTITFENGNAQIKLAGTSEYIDEAQFRVDSGLSTGPNRTIESDTYLAYNAQSILNGLYESGVSYANLPKHLITANSKLNQSDFFTDLYGYTMYNYRGKRMADPTDMEARSEYTKYVTGIYVPENCVLPLGDNRDNSSDGRYFGPVSTDSINGYVVTRIWPLSRIGSPY